jgi:hypothetical protein
MTDDLLVCLNSDSSAERRAAVREILKRRNVAHDQLRALVDRYIGTGSRHETIYDVMVLLGRLRAIELIPWFLGHLTYRSSSWIIRDGATPDRVYPAVAALIEIGAPALKPMLARLASHGDEETRAVIETFLRKVLGKYEAIERVTRELASAADPSARINFTALLDDLRSW